MSSQLLKQELKEKAKLISELRNELESTNKGILILIMELEQATEEKVREGQKVIGQLQQELAETDQGLMALAIELDSAKEKYRNILEHAREAIFTFDDTTKIETFNSAALTLFGFKETELVLLKMNQIVPGFDRVFADTINLGLPEQEYIKTSYASHIALMGQKKNSRSFPIEMTIGSPFYSDKKTWMVIIRDITERKIAEQGLRLMAKIFEDSNDAIMITDTRAVIVDVNAAFSIITGFKRHEVLGKKPSLMKSGYHDADFFQALWETLIATGKWYGEIWDKKKNGEIYPKWLSISAVKDEKGSVSHFVAIFTDITHRKEAENKLMQLAHFDQLTGLPNRTLFLEKLQWSIELAERNSKYVALLFLDLDRFKIINDTLGHQAGDQVLIEVARRLKESMRKTDIVCRLAGDEFTIVLTEISDKDEIDSLAQKLLDTLAKPLSLNEREIFITASIGMAIYPLDSQDANDLLKNADTAMYHAKSLGKNTYAFYLDSMNKQVQDELELETNLRKALYNSEFMLFYQPQIALDTGKIVGVEALIRWRHPKLGFISPTRFIPYAEQSDLIIHIGNWVLTSACKQFVEWVNEGLPPIKMSVNYSGVQLKQYNQVTIISNILQETKMDPNYLCLELTESVAMENAENTIKTLHTLKQMGISISIDDFGTGYSSLSYLKRFPIDTLKIDRSFINDIIENPDDSAIASTIIAMAHHLRLSVIAEGVETKAQLLELKAKGCDQVQGFYLSHPKSAEDIKDFILKFAQV